MKCLTSNCAGVVTKPPDGCEQCEMFCCAQCARWVSWDKGCSDEQPDVCDDCVEEDDR